MEEAATAQMTVPADTPGAARTIPEQAAPVVIERVSKSYGSVAAVRSVSLQVPRASIYALVGPNGAGKTTVVECVEGLRSPDEGVVKVLGLDPVRERVRLYQRVGVHLQDSTMHARLRAGEVIRLFASLYDNAEDGDVLLRRFGLEDVKRKFFGRLSGGQKRRLMVALALIGRPELAILDEPTTGLDPQARHNVWAILKELRRSGMTILLTTHYLEEAEDHCDQVVMIDEGTIVAAGRPAELLERHGLGVRIAIQSALAPDEDRLARLPAVTHVERLPDELLVYGRDNAVYDAALAACAAERAAVARGIEVRRARLEDLYLLLTGRAYRKESP
jgi:ABC-2 type transport system ATP-binding protein